MDRLIKIGKIKSISSDKVLSSRFGIGMEKLDRGLFDPSKTYDKLQKCGVKYVRLQSGWQRTEEKKGVYNFGWLDEIVDNLISHGMIPWICLCYGNKLYSPKAGKVFGGVGVPPIFTKEEKEGWANYCEAIAKHYKGKVSMFEIWNEPDGAWCWKHGVNGKEYGEFVIDTSKALKNGNKDVYVIGGSISGRDSVSWFEAMLQTGCYNHIDAVTYHLYSKTESRVFGAVDNFRAIINKYNPKIELIQGEEGCPSSSKGHGALSKGAWNEEKQAKVLLCRFITDLTTGIKFTSWFSTVDMIEALNGKEGEVQSYLDYGYFGILGAMFDENGKSIGDFKEKKSYYALQNLCAFAGKTPLKNVKMPVLAQNDRYTERVFGVPTQLEDVLLYGFENANGDKALAYYRPTDIITTSFEGVTSLVIDMPVKEMTLFDPMDGSVYKIKDDQIEDLGNGVYKLYDIPVKDYPLMLCFGNFLDYGD